MVWSYEQFSIASNFDLEQLLWTTSLHNPSNAFFMRAELFVEAENPQLILALFDSSLIRKISIYYILDPVNAILAV